MGSIMSLIRDVGRQRGVEKELMVDMALTEMKRDGEIASFYKTDDRVDKFQGIDFVVFGLEGEKVPLQIKSSLTGAQKHWKKFPDVPVVIVGMEDAESIKEKIRNLM